MHGGLCFLAKAPHDYAPLQDDVAPPLAELGVSSRGHVHAIVRGQAQDPIRQSEHLQLARAWVMPKKRRLTTRATRRSPFARTRTGGGLASFGEVEDPRAQPFCLAFSPSSASCCALP